MTKIEEVVLRRAKRRISDPKAWTQFANARRPKDSTDDSEDPRMTMCEADDPAACQWCATAAVDRELIDLTDEERKDLGWDMFTYMRIMERLAKAAEATGMFSEYIIESIENDGFDWHGKTFPDGPAVLETETEKGDYLTYDEVYTARFNDEVEHRSVMDMFELALGDQPGAEGANA